MPNAVADRPRALPDGMPDSSPVESPESVARTGIRTMPAAIALVVLMGVTGFAVNPVVSALTVRFAGGAPTLAAGLTLDTGLGLSGPTRPTLPVG